MGAKDKALYKLYQVYQHYAKSHNDRGFVVPIIEPDIVRVWNWNGPIAQIEALCRTKEAPKRSNAMFNVDI